MEIAAALPVCDAEMDRVDVADPEFKPEDGEELVNTLEITTLTEVDE